MLDLFKTLLRPDRVEDPGRTVVAEAANIIQVGEFQFLQLAYFDWYGEELPDEAMDSVFQLYMVRGEIPAWARHYAREVLRKASEGALDDSDPSLHRYDQEYVTHVPRGVRRFLGACFCLIAVMTTALAIGSLATTTSSQELPPYFHDEELQPRPKGPGAS